MILTFTKIPKSQPCDLSKSFDPMQTTPDVATKIGELNTNRNKFYGEVNKATQAPLEEIQDGLDWMSMLAYLNSGPDLLEIAVKRANYPIVLSYMPMTVPTPIQENAGKKSFPLSLIQYKISFCDNIFFQKVFC